jgi:hypothetical protein
MATDLVLKFRETDNGLGVTRETLEALAKELGMTEEMTVHLAIQRLANEVLADYEPDDGPLSEEYVQWLNNAVKPLLPKGKRLSRKTLF